MDYIYSVRETTADDKQSVVQIHDNVYDGLDYLQDYYDYFQYSEHVTSYVYTENDKIIAYVACCRVDNGETIVTRAGRVCPDRHGKHLYSRFKSEIETLQNADGITKRYALLKSETPSESFLNSYKPVATKDIHMFEYHRSDISSNLKLLTSGCSSGGIVVDNIPTDYLSPPYSHYMFPEGRIILDWVPYRLLFANILLFKGRDTVFYTDITFVEENTVQELNKATKQPKTKQSIQGLLSASTVFKAHYDLDLSCNLDIFGTDFRSLRDHIIFHLQRIEAVGLENINLRIFTTKGEYESSLIDQILGPLGVQMLTSGSRKEQYKDQVVYENAITR